MISYAALEVPPVRPRDMIARALTRHSSIAPKRKACRQRRASGSLMRRIGSPRKGRAATFQTSGSCDEVWGRSGNRFRRRCRAQREVSRRGLVTEAGKPDRPRRRLEGRGIAHGHRDVEGPCLRVLRSLGRGAPVARLFPGCDRPSARSAACHCFTEIRCQLKKFVLCSSLQNRSGGADQLACRPYSAAVALPWPSPRSQHHAASARMVHLFRRLGFTATTSRPAKCQETGHCDISVVVCLINV